MAYGDRKSDRVQFERRIPVYMMAIDGTWRRDCQMIDVSQTGARLHIDGSLAGIDLRECFLLSSTGLAYRRCQLVGLDGDQLGVEFLTRDSLNRKAQSGPMLKGAGALRVRGYCPLMGAKTEPDSVTELPITRLALITAGQEWEGGQLLRFLRR